jgi:hypothetical protein
MRLRYVLGVVLLLTLAGCGAYKELKPKPRLSPLEGSYIELTRKKSEKKTEWFELKRGKKYYMRFPPPQADHFYLVLRTDQKALFNAYFTNSFSKGKRPDPRIRDENDRPNEMVYRIDRSIPQSFWVIETVGQDLTLLLAYRYVPVWRYTFENKHAAFQDRLAQNRIDRAPYNTLGTSFRFTNFNFATEMDRLAGASGNLQTLHAELKDLEALFPRELLNSSDPAYRNYVDLRDNLQEEMGFQENYREVLTVFRTEAETRRDMGGFLRASPAFNAFLGQTGRFPQPILNEAQSVLGGRLSGVVPYLEQEIANKNEVSPIQFGFDLAAVETLYQRCGQTPPPSFQSLASFIRAYNAEAGRLAPAQAKLAEAARYGRPEFTWPSDTHYGEGLKHIAELNRIVPEQRSASFQVYDTFPCVALLNREVGRLRSEAARWGRDYAEAQGVVPQINALRPQQAYRTIIQLLSAHRRLDFLLQQYPDVDQLSLDQQQTGVTVALAGRDWPGAERQLRALHQDDVFLRLDRIAPVKRAAVERLEGQLVTAVEQTSKQRVDAFVAANKLTIDNVEGLYSDSAFTPVYVLTFTAGSPATLQQRNADIRAYIDNLKYHSFPAAAIPEIYREFTRNIRDRGVEKARAIVTHGKYYKGDDRQVKNLIAECDPYTPKWITKPTEYRKVYVLPVTSSGKGENKYLFRLNVRIPSEAKFPVFDVNIKLPKEVAARSAARAWYDYIRLNKEDLKPQGRFTITAPTAENGYEAQLTPVQMRADDNNILEVQFTHPSFQVFEISTMSQRPIMRKD